MTAPISHILHTGSDPRGLAEFIALRQEIIRMNNSASDVDWQRVEQLAIALFRVSGMDLQSVAWYTLARAWRTGLTGLCEGLEIATAMMKHQWPTLWPHPLSARLAIITWLSAGIQQVLPTLSLTREDLTLLLQLQNQLQQNVEILEKLAQKHLSQLDRLIIQVSHLIELLQMAEPGVQPAPQQETDLISAIQSSSRHGDKFTPLIYVPHDLTSSSGLNVTFSFWERSQKFFAGMALMAILSGITLWGYYLLQPEPGKAQRVALLAQQITPERVNQYQNWQQMIVSTALPVEQLVLWNTARSRLKKLATMINVADIKSEVCIPVAEIKAQLFTIQQPLQAALPVEELLRQLEKNKQSPVLRGKIDHRLKQLMARYALILQADEREKESAR